MTEDILHRKDPLLNGTPDYGKDLFNRFSKVGDGYPADAVLSAALNVIVNVLRQTYGHRNQAERRYDEVVGQTKQSLLNFYDSTTGRRRSTIPFHQIIQAPFHVDKDKEQLN